MENLEYSGRSHSVDRQVLRIVLQWEDWRRGCEEQPLILLWADFCKHYDLPNTYREVFGDAGSVW